MPTFAIIDPHTCRIEIKPFADYKAALHDAGLGARGVDFATIGQFADGISMSVILYEFGLLESLPDGFWSIGGLMLQGPGVIFCADAEGETIDLFSSLLCPDPSGRGRSRLEGFITWLGERSSAEAAIQAGTILRPQSTVNGEVLWEWRA